MAKTVFKGISISGITGAVPKNTINNLADHSFIPEKDRKKIVELTGVAEYRRASAELCASDLCETAAKNLLSGLNVEPKSIDAIIFVSMTPDYRIPSTACILQNKIGCGSSTVAFDINMGCSGFVVGLFNACTLIQGAGMKRVLLLAGDTQSKMCHPQDKNVVFLFGDGGTATLVEANRQPDDSVAIELLTDGSRFDKLIIPAGGFRNPSTESTRKARTQPDGGIRSEEQVYMDGMEIFKFSSTDVVKSILNFMESGQLAAPDFDFLVLHQANKFMTDKIARKLKFPMDKVPYSIGLYGNTGSASIPLTIAHNYGELIPTSKKRFLLSGFGVGLSWGIVDVFLDDIYCAKIAEC